MATRRRRRLFSALLLLAPCCCIAISADLTPAHPPRDHHLPAPAVIGSAAAPFDAATPGEAATHGGGQQSAIVDAGGGPLAQPSGIDTRPSLLDAWNFSGENELSDLSNNTLGGPHSSTLTNGPEEALETTTPLASTPPRRTPPPLPPLLRVLLRTTSAAPGAAPPRPGRPLFLPPVKGATPHPKSWFPPGRNADPQAGGAAPMPRFGPYFEEGAEGSNLTARLGSTVLLDCKIGMLRDKTVTWLHRKEDAIHLLTVGRQTYSSDSRFSLAYRYPNNWRLQILFASRRDEGIYECQVATHPPRIRQIFLRVTAPEVKIVDEDFHEVLERYYKAGSQVELTCLASQLERGGGEDSSAGGGGVVAGEGESSPAIAERDTAGRATAGGRVFWRHGDAAITHNTSGRGIWTNMSDDGLSASVTMTLRSAKKSDGGNYTCTADGQASATVSIHILNGELPAAVQYGNSTVPFGTVSVILQIWCLAVSLSTIKR